MRFESDLTQKKNEKLLIKEAFKANDENGKRLNANTPNIVNTSYVKSKVLEIEKKLQMEGNNESTIK